MSLSRFIKSIVDAETMGEEIVNTNVKTYFSAKKMQPNLTSLDWLNATYMGRMQANGLDFSEFNQKYSCSNFDKLPEPSNAKALGLAMLHLERSDIVAKYPKFTEELDRLMKSIAANPRENQKTKPKREVPSLPKVSSGSRQNTIFKKTGNNPRSTSANIQDVPLAMRYLKKEKVEKSPDEQKRIHEDVETETKGEAKARGTGTRNRPDGSSQQHKKSINPAASEFDKSATLAETESSEDDKKLLWLREEWEILQKKKAQGRKLDDYEKRLEDQYEKLIGENSFQTQSSTKSSEKCGWEDLVERDNLFYKKFSDVPYTGEAIGKTQASFKNGKKDGPYIDYDKNGNVTSKGSYKDGKKEGLWVLYHDNGQLHQKGAYKDGKEHGPWVSYHDNGQLESKGTFKDGKQDGSMRWYNQKGHKYYSET